MANQKISELTELTSVSTGDLIPIVDISDTTDASTGTTKKITQSNLVSGKAPRGTLVIATTGGTTTLTSAQFENMAFDVTGTLVSNATIIIPDNISQLFVIDNATTGAFTLTIKHSATAGVDVAQGNRMILYTNGTTVESVSATGGGSGITSLNGLTGVTQTFTNDTNITITSSGTAHTLGFSGQLASSRGGTGNGFTKFSGPTTAEKTFTLPDASSTLLYSGGDLGTPSSGTLTNCTGLNILTGLTNYNFPDGFLINGKIVPSVATNNLTVAIKGMNGNNPSATNPVYVRIGDTIRSITAALSVTKNAGTNWFNSGSSELATIETDYFVYMGYNATDGVVVGFSRIPYARIYSDFSATTTNEKYAAISTITTAAAGDNYVNIGRFAATLSAGAGYTWTVPTFTTINLIQQPITKSRWSTWTPTLGGFSANPTNSNYRYMIRDDVVTIIFDQQGDGTSNTTALTGTIPFTAKTITNMVWLIPCLTQDNGTVSACGRAYIVSAGATLNINNTMAGGAFTASGNKRCEVSALNYQI